MQFKWTEFLFVVFSFALPPASDGFQSLSLLSTYIKGETQFPKFSCTTILNDIIVGYYNKTYIPRGNTTNEDDVIGADYIKSITGYIYESFLRRSSLLSQNYQNSRLDVYQTLVVCELLDSDTPGKMIVSDAARGSTIDKILYTNNTFTYIVTGNVSQELIKPHLEGFKEEFATFFYPVCIKTLKNYIKKRESQVNRRETPNIRLFKKASGSGGSCLSCLATGFYPHHIILTLLRDGQPVSDHKVTGGDLLPNGDGTYQMWKSLEIRAEERQKHKYSCSVEHLGRNYKLDIILDDSDRRHIGVVLVVLCAIFVILAIVWKSVCQTGRQRPRGTTRTLEEL